jgi:hypothetical protein
VLLQALDPNDPTAKMLKKLGLDTEETAPRFRVLRGWFESGATWLIDARNRLVDGWAPSVATFALPAPGFADREDPEETYRRLEDVSMLLHLDPPMMSVRAPLAFDNTPISVVIWFQDGTGREVSQTLSAAGDFAVADVVIPPSPTGSQPSTVEVFLPPNPEEG